MRTTLLGKKHGSDEWLLIAGPNVTTTDQIAIRAKIMETHPVNDVWECVELWEEEPLKHKLKFKTKEQTDSEAADLARSDEEIKNSRKEAEERQAARERESEAAAANAHEKEVEKLNKLHAETVAAQEPINKAQIEKRAAGQLPKEKK